MRENEDDAAFILLVIPLHAVKKEFMFGFLEPKLMCVDCRGIFQGQHPNIILDKAMDGTHISRSTPKYYTRQGNGWDPQLN